MALNLSFRWIAYIAYTVGSQRGGVHIQQSSPVT